MNMWNVHRIQLVDRSLLILASKKPKNQQSKIWLNAKLADKIQFYPDEKFLSKTIINLSSKNKRPFNVTQLSDNEFLFYSFLDGEDYRCKLYITFYELPKASEDTDFSSNSFLKYRTEKHVHDSNRTFSSLRMQKLTSYSTATRLS